MERISKFRASMVLVLVAVLFAALAFKIYDLQIIETGGNVDNQDTFTIITRVKAARGDILDRDGNLLVSNRASYDVAVNHYVLLTADNTNQNILRLIQRCEEADIEYTEHFPVSKERPFTYTLEAYNATWQNYFQIFLEEIGGLDSDITAPLLVEKLREKYKIPTEWTDDEARKVIGILYEMSLRKYISSLPSFIFITDASDEELAAIVELNIPGIKVEYSTVREYNTKYAAHILGYVGAMSPQQWEYYKTIPGYDMDAHVGQDGLEAAYEEYLHGIDGWRMDTVTTDGTLISSEYLSEPKAGSNVEVSIDLDLQMAGEDAMAEVIEELRNQEPGPDNKPKPGHDVEGGAFTAMDVKTGQVLACGSYPTYDLSTFFENFEELSQNEDDPIFNRALLATYPPGSTYKMSMIVAAMESGLIDAEYIVYDKGKYDEFADTGKEGEGKGLIVYCMAYTNYGYTHKEVNAVKALQVSCNYFFYDLGSKIRLSVMDSTAKGFGLGEKTGVELPEYIGHRANAETKKELYEGENEMWFTGDQILSAIGQSENRFTPMQLCVYTSTLANQGDRYKATFMSRVVSSDYRTLLEENKPELLSHMDISDETYRTYCEGMYRVTSTEEGTADTAFMNYPIKVAGKTGTAETGIDGTSDNVAFVCFAPLEDPQIAVSIYVEKGGSAAKAAMIARSILDVYFDVDEVGDVVCLENQIG